MKRTSAEVSYCNFSNIGLLTIEDIYTKQKIEPVKHFVNPDTGYDFYFEVEGIQDYYTVSYSTLKNDEEPFTMYTISHMVNGVEVMKRSIHTKGSSEYGLSVRPIYDELQKLLEGIEAEGYTKVEVEAE